MSAEPHTHLSEPLVHFVWLRSVGDPRRETNRMICGFTTPGAAFADASTLHVNCKACRVQVARALRVGMIYRTRRSGLLSHSSVPYEPLFPEVTASDEELLNELLLVEAHLALMQLDQP